MQTLLSPHRRSRSGFAVLITLAFLTVMLTVFASMLYWSTTNANITKRNVLYNNAEYAAESSEENILATMMRDFTYGSLNSSPSAYNTLKPSTNGWPIAFQFSDTNGNTAYTATVTIAPFAWSVLTGQFDGLAGYAQYCQVASTATPLNQGNINLSATVYQSEQFALVPVFQFAVFYNMDLEINPGADMVINGKVWSNGNIWSSPSSPNTLSYSNTVDASGQIYYVRDPNDPNGNGSSNQVKYLITMNNPLQNVDTLTMPIGTGTNNNPTNVQAIIYPPPAGYAPPNYSAAYGSNGTVYLENAVDLIITNAANGTNGTSGTNITVYYQNQNDTSQYIQTVPPDVLASSNVTGSGSSKTTNLVYAYSFVTNATFYDYRESDNSGARGGLTYNNLNTGASGSVSKGHGINSIYAYNSVPMNVNQLPAVRLTDGAQLPNSGLTVVTPQPMYVEGNYNVQTNGTAANASAQTTNTAYTVPASIMADAITILSPSWSDTYNINTPLTASSGTQRQASADTVNAALLVGIVPSVTTAGGKQYSGGLENYLRLLENWSGISLQYNGSEVGMYSSLYATNFWPGTGTVYNAPNRNWGFDNNFMNYAKLPPLTPEFKAISRFTWLAW
jgi:hypothetical protein